MKKVAIRILIAVMLVATSVIVGWQLTYVIDLLPFNMPEPVEMFIRLCLSATGNDDLVNPDDMEVLALLFYWTLSALMVGALLCAGARGLRHLRVRKTSQKPI
ncbi:hypothetical protein [Paraburkholderia sp.]|jgi:hypothetical protein|uniref:hypothetical protein n=1 Tax=Paraburkholderia sp. TaxID=1926495 RepID=UPI002F3F8D1C